MGTSLLFSAYVVALVKQWKLALILMSILPALVLIIGVCLAFDAPIETRVVSFLEFSAKYLDSYLCRLSLRLESTLAQEPSPRTHSPP